MRSLLLLLPSATAVGPGVQATAAAGPHALPQAARCQHDLHTPRAAPCSDGSISERQVDLVLATDCTVLRLMQAWWDRKAGECRACRIDAG
jgi:hypothetical protein